MRVWSDWSRRGGLPVVLFGAVFLYGLAYRARLYFRFLEDELTKHVEFIGLLQFPVYDLLFAGALGLLAVPAARLFRAQAPGPAVRWGLLLLLQPILGLIVLLYTTHYGLVFSVRSGLTWDMIVETFAAGAAFAMAGELTLSDQMHIALLFAFFWGLYALPRAWNRARNVALGALALPFVLFAAVLRAPGPEITNEIRMNPVLYTAADMVRSALASGAGAAAGPPRDQMQSVALVSKRFATEPPGGMVVDRGGRRWNVVVVILESTGGEYVFSTRYGNEVPMRFLRGLAARGLWMTNHLSTANTTPRGSFSVFSGLYPAPQLKMFVTRPDVAVPSLLQYLGQGYDGFLVYNGSLDWFFPRGFFHNNGVELYGMENVTRPRWRHGPTNGRNEEQMVDFFLERLGRTKEPFLAVYHSYAAHWPYIDYGDRFDVFRGKKPDIHEWIYRYYNNLRLMDMQIERIVKQLEREGRMQNTILVVTGDHGQAFGKHKGNWIHSRASYLENYRVPLVIYQPRLFAARVVKERTQHVDILPTLLGAMGRSYNPRLLQGEDLRAGRVRRRYDFLYGNERTLSTIDRTSQLKLQISLKTGKCWAFDLARDPNEARQLTCDTFGAQKAATLDYAKYQTQILEAYNRTSSAGTAFHGERHPWQRERARAMSGLSRGPAERRPTRERGAARRVAGPRALVAAQDGS